MFALSDDPSEEQLQRFHSGSKQFFGNSSGQVPLKKGDLGGSLN
jgi:hypothetical protein